MPEVDTMDQSAILQRLNESIKLPIESTVYITRQDVIDLIITAVEGSINYWAAVSEYDVDYGTVKVHVEHGNCRYNNEHEHYIVPHLYADGYYEAEGFSITPENFLELGIKRYDAYWSNSKDYKGIIDAIENQDADNCDSMMQFCVLGSIVYG
jgi:hypothetical protein